MGRATRGALDERTPRGRGTGKEPSERVAPTGRVRHPVLVGAAPHRMQPAPVRTRTTGAGLARVGVASGTALDRTGSGPGGDGLDLDAGPQRQGGHPEGGPGREGLAGEVAGVDLVDGGEVGDVGEQDRSLDDVVVPEPGLGQDGAHVLEDLLGLGLDVALDERAGGRVERHLPGDEDERAGPLTGGDALGVGADGGGGVGRGDTADGHGFLVPAGRWGSAAFPAGGVAARVAAQWRRRPGQTTHAFRIARFLDSGWSTASGSTTPLRSYRRTAVKLPSIPSRDDLTARARGLAGQAASGAAKAADTVSRAAAGAATQTSQRLGVDRLPGLPGLSRPAKDDGAPIDVDAGPQITGTPFARTLATAFAARPHTRSARSLLMGADFLRTGLRLGGRERKQLKSRGFAAETTGATGTPDLDVTELIHVHGRRLPNLMRNASYRVIKRDVRAVTDHGSATGSLHWIGVSEQEHARGAMGWTRLCVDTDQTDRLPVLSGDHHLDVVIAPVGQEPGEYASDMAGLLPQGIPAEAWQALTADPTRPVTRLHLLGQDRIGVDAGGDTYTLFRNVPHTVRGSLLIMGNRVRRAELWLADRANIDILEWLPV